MSTDQYFATREAWLRAVLADKDLPASAFKVAFYLSLLANRKAFEERGVLEAWPGLQTIADGTALRKATVMDVIGRLKMAGWITVLPGKEGRGCHNTYQLTL